MKCPKCKEISKNDVVCPTCNYTTPYLKWLFTGGWYFGVALIFLGILFIFSLIKLIF